MSRRNSAPREVRAPEQPAPASQVPRVHDRPIIEGFLRTLRDRPAAAVSTLLESARRDINERWSSNQPDMGEYMLSPDGRRAGADSLLLSMVRERIGVPLAVHDYEEIRVMLGAIVRHYHKLRA